MEWEKEKREFYQKLCEEVQKRLETQKRKGKEKRSYIPMTFWDMIVERDLGKLGSLLKDPNLWTQPKTWERLEKYETDAPWADIHYLRQVQDKGGYQKAMQADLAELKSTLARLTTEVVKRWLTVTIVNLTSFLVDKEVDRAFILDSGLGKDPRLAGTYVLQRGLASVRLILNWLGVPKVYRWAGGILYYWGLLSREDVGLTEREPYWSIWEDPISTREYKLAARLRKALYDHRRRTWKALEPIIERESSM